MLGALVLIIGAFGCAGRNERHPQTTNLGRTPSSAEIAAIDIDIAPDGTGLPPGHGTARDGESVFQQRCANCHNQSSLPLAGGIGTLAGDDPKRTVGSFWPYATTVFDYVRRAMPPDRQARLSNDEIYAVTAFILAINGAIGPGDIMDRTTLPRVAMPNRAGFSDSQP